MKPALTTGAIRPLFPAGLRPAVPAHLRDKTTPDYLPVTDSSLAVFTFGSSALVLAPSGHLLAWVYPGFYRTQRHDKHFFDVAYIKPCATKAGDPTGFMLDSDCFDTEAEVLTFVESLVQAGGAV
ncbi:MAG: hypothetical protein R3E89_15600 [Thiolinea sp.]